MDKYISKHNETKTYTEWRTWAVGFYQNLDMKPPTDWWNKTVKVLGLTKVGGE